MSSTPSSAYITHNPARYLAQSFAVRTVIFLSLHIPLAAILAWSGWLGTGHAAIVFLYGLRAALRQRSANVLYTLGYIAGAEVLWRMTGAKLLWEHGKYASLLIVGIALLVEWRPRTRTRPLNFWIILYAALLFPAAIPTLAQLGLPGSLTHFSFNLSGHLALVGLSLYLWRRPMTRNQLTKLLLAVIAPIVGITFLALYSTVTTEVTFILESNFVTSGGFGPNQVSNILGLGALAGILFIILQPSSPGLRFFVLLVTFSFIIQGLLTFSRGGVFSFLLALMTFGLHLLPTPRTRRRFFLLAVILYAFGTFIVLPNLDTFTGGIIRQRFSDFDGSGRVEAALADWQSFQEHPVVGTGIGLSGSNRRILLGKELAAHTEFTRMLAEHGLPGLAALLLLLGVLWQRYRSAVSNLDKALTATFIVWPMLVMLQSAMRFVAVSFVLSLALVVWDLKVVGNERE